MKNKIVFLILFLFLCACSLLAATATVINNGNVTVRVQYKTPDGQYEDLGYVKPGETVNVPGGVEKVKIVRDYGEWARPLKPGEVLDVEVKEDSKSVGKMNWYGDKIFFSPLTDGPPPAVSTAPVLSGTQAGQNELPKSESPKTESQPESAPIPQKSEIGESVQTQPSNWPWYGGLGDYIFFLQFFLLWLPFAFLWGRHWRQPGYYIEGEWVEAPRLSWGWGWQDSGCGRIGLMYGFAVGAMLAALALWGGSIRSPESSFLALFARDLYVFPYFLLSLIHVSGGGFSDIAFILLFWILICTSFGGLCGVIPLQWIYVTPFFLMMLPFFLFMRGCVGSEPFAYDGGYGGELYPTAFSSFSMFPMILSFFLDWVDPYYEMDEDEEEDAGDALWDFLHGNPFPLLVFLSGGCVCCFYGIAYEFGWDFAISKYFHDIPFWFGLNFIHPYFTICLFWFLIFGGLGWAFYSHPERFAFYSCWIPAFLILIFLMMGNYPQRHFDFYEGPLNAGFYYIPGTDTMVGQGGKKPLVVQDRFADNLRSRGSGQAGLGRDVIFGTEGNRRREENSSRW